MARSADPDRRVRKVVALPELLWLRVAHYRFDQRIPSERAAVEALIMVGLAVAERGMPCDPKRLEAALHRIAQWSDAYPLDAFPEPDAVYCMRAATVLKANGMTLDRLSAASMRYVITQVGKIAKGALSPP